MSIQRGKSVTHAGSGASDLKLEDGCYSFKVDVVAPQSGGDYDLVVLAGKRYLAHGTVTVVDKPP